MAEVNFENSTDNFLHGFENIWTFRSCLGVQRILDYCLLLAELIIETSKSINDLDLGSDHRAVQCCVLLPCAFKTRSKRRGRRKINWDLYKSKMNDNESGSYPSSLQDLERHVVEVAEEC